MITSEIQLFQILKQKLGEKEAEALVEFVDSKLKENNESNLKVLATREDIANLRGEMKVEIANTKADLPARAGFIFWIGQLASFIAIAKFIFHQ